MTPTVSNYALITRPCSRSRGSLFAITSVLFSALHPAVAGLASLALSRRAPRPAPP